MKSGTSIKEQALFYFVKQFFPNAQNRSVIKYNNKKYELNEKNYDYINETLSYLHKKEKRQELSEYEVNEDVYNSALKFIYSELYPSTVEPNIADMCGIECWNQEKNTPLNPKNVGIYEWVPALMICPNGNELQTAVGLLKLPFCMKIFSK